MLAVHSSIKKLGIDKLGVSERLDLIGNIWDSVLSDGNTMPVPDWHKAEVHRRLQQFAADGNPGRSAKEAIADIKRQL